MKYCLICGHRKDMHHDGSEIVGGAVYCPYAGCGCPGFQDIPKLSKKQIRYLWVASLDVDARREVSGCLRWATWKSLEKRALIEVPGRFGNCWSITDLGLKRLAMEKVP